MKTEIIGAMIGAALVIGAIVLSSLIMEGVVN